MKRFLIFLIKLYQSTPLKTHNLCRHYPTCSNYMIESIETYGCVKGVIKGIKRIARCNPWGSYGYDPLKKEKI